MEPPGEHDVRKDEAITIEDSGRPTSTNLG
jgi:hypothetical protein